MRLIPFSEFEVRLPGVSRRTLERLALEGSFPRFVRLTARGEPLWDATAIERWLADKLAAIAEGGPA